MRYALPCLLLLAACGGADVPAAAWQTVTDTLGDTVVVRTVGAADSAALLTLRPELRIGELDGAEEYQFGYVAAVLPAPGGGVYVWDGTLKTLRLYDASGAFVRQLGRRGGGPGEYEESNGMALLPDGRLAFWDPRNARVMLYDSAGPAPGGWRTDGSFFTSRGTVADTAGRVYLTQMLDPHDAGVPFAQRRSGWVRYQPPDGAVLDSLPPPLPPDRALQLTATRREGQSTSSSTTTVPFTPQSSCAVSPFGYFVCGNGARYAVTLARPEGPLRLERDVPRVPVQADERASEEETITAMLRGTDPSWRWSGPAIPAEKPYFRAVQVGADGRVWVTRSTAGERIPDEELAEGLAARERDPRRPPPRRWREHAAYDVFEPDGRFVGHLVPSRRTSLHYMRGDTVWGVQRDSLDVPYVVRFRLAPADSSAGAGAGAP